MSFQCQRCFKPGTYPAWVTARYHENTVHRCDRCGTAHSCRYGRPAEAIPPRLLPIDADTQRLSPWIDGRYRPYLRGVFECEFRDGTTLRLIWNGRFWQWCGLRVDIMNLVKWRGRWGSSE